MLSAQKEQLRLVASETPEGQLPNVGSFGKVVNSIQGLQQRLESFSADDVGAAHDRTQTLLLRLSELQRKLATFAAIKDSMTVVRGSLDQMLSDCVDLSKIDALENPLPTPELIHASKLIQFPRLNKLVDMFAHQVAEGLTHDITVRSMVDDTHGQQQPNQDLHGPLETQVLREEDLAISETEFPTHHDTPTAVVVAPENTADTLQSSPVPDSSTRLDSAVAVDLTTFPSEEPQVYDDDSWGPQKFRTSTGPRVKTEEHTRTNAAVTTGTEFDQRLLDDLIQNYGEFTAALSSFRAGDSPDSATTDPSETETRDTVPPIHGPSETNKLPSIKREGDIDRQLKKIIKDYGEYDLYSRQSPVNLKTGVVAAFLLLALILSAFYYFSPKTTDAEGPLATTPVGTHSSSSSERTDKQNGADQPAAEAGAPHITDNNSSLKTRK